MREISSIFVLIVCFDDTDRSSFIRRVYEVDLFELSHMNDGQGSFLYTVTSCVKPFSPFYPGSFGSETQPGNIVSISVATENGGLLNSLCDELSQSAKTPTREEARCFLFERMNKAFKTIEVGWQDRSV